MEKHQALIATFYAFKGGTGRTLALANVARLLCDEMGYRVGLMDLDVDSPGLVHEALSRDLDPLGATVDPTQPSLRNALIGRIGDTKGFLELFIDRAAGRAHSPDPASIDEHVCALPGIGSGNIVLMPTARDSIEKKQGYVETVEKFTRVFANPSLDGDGAARLTLQIANDFIDRYQLDFLFIDGRTGAGPFSPVYTYAIPHLLVLFFGLNDQNITGSLSVVAKAAGALPSTPVPVFLVASPVPTVGPAALERRLGFVNKQLSARRDGSLLYDLPERVEHMLYYSDAASFGEAYFPGQYPHSLLAQGYRKLACDIEQLVVRTPANSKSPANGHHLPVPDDSSKVIQIAVENVHLDLVNKALQESAGHNFDVRGFGAEDPQAPWMLAAGGSAALPDVMMVPQSRLKELADKDLLLEVRVERNETPSGFDLDFLDSYYRKWRKRCSVDGKLVSLPFSVNANLMCANLDALEPHCDRYWDERKQKGGKVFVPGSWQSLLELLMASERAGQDPREIFSIVGKGPGLHYDWLNCVISLGGYGLLVSDGHLDSVGFARPETREATKLFMRLARRSHHSETMDDQIKRFSRGESTLYMGWTDSFRFWREGGALDRVSPTPLSSNGHPAAGGAPLPIRLSRSPRDMRQPHTCLVDGWMMTFPRQRGRKAPSAGALGFAKWFLDADRQRSLLRDGFPTASGWAVDRELEAVQADRLNALERDLEPARLVRTLRAEASFEVFLNTMRTAIRGARWVASRSTVDEPLEAALTDLINFPADHGDDRALDKEVDRVLDDLQREAVARWSLS